MRPRLLIVAGPNGAGKTTVTDAGLAHQWFTGVFGRPAGLPHTLAAYWHAGPLQEE
jgi:ABC-type molybdenum transport system ATPase subunit/photorepair protein PhrA